MRKSFVTTTCALLFTLTACGYDPYADDNYKEVSVTEFSAAIEKVEKNAIDGAMDLDYEYEIIDGYIKVDNEKYNCNNFKVTKEMMEDDDADIPEEVEDFMVALVGLSMTLITNIANNVENAKYYCGDKNFKYETPDCTFVMNENFNLIGAKGKCDGKDLFGIKSQKYEFNFTCEYGK